MSKYFYLQCVINVGRILGIKEKCYYYVYIRVSRNIYEILSTEKFDILEIKFDNNFSCHGIFESIDSDLSGFDYDKLINYKDSNLMDKISKHAKKNKLKLNDGELNMIRNTDYGRYLLNKKKKLIKRNGNFNIIIKTH